MQSLLEVGEAVAARRRSLGLKQGDVAALAGISQETLSRFERGKLAELGSRKLLVVLVVLAVLGAWNWSSPKRPRLVHSMSFGVSVATHERGHSYPEGGAA
jgi:HTH-type transcriptional regulator / antitoxin HipB